MLYALYILQPANELYEFRTDKMWILNDGSNYFKSNGIFLQTT